jgi:hypothetical protein
VFGSILMRGEERKEGEQNPSYTHFLLLQIRGIWREGEERLTILLQF